MDTDKSLQYLLDRLAIEDQVKRYAHLIDRKGFDRLGEVFTEDAHIDYTASGGEAGDLTQSKAFLRRSLSKVRSQHLLSNLECELAADGSSAKTICILHNPMTNGTRNGDYTYFCGLWYHMDWIKTGGEWKVTSLRQEFSYMFNAPAAVLKEAKK